MDTSLRVITHLPLVELWRGDGFSTTKREKFLTQEDVRQFLTSGPVQFVVADLGTAPRGFQKVIASDSGMMRQEPTWPATQKRV